MKKVLEFLNGKKTVIGAILSILITYLKVKDIIDMDTATLLGSLSGLLFAFGVGHKVKKAVDKTED